MLNNKQHLDGSLLLPLATGEQATVWCRPIVGADLAVMD